MTTTSVSRAATTGLVGGALWALFPVAFGVVALEDVESGTLSWFAVAASYWIFGVVPPVLIAVGLAALRRSLGDGLGTVGRVGLPVTGAGLVAMALGNGVEVASLTAGGGEVGLGHAFFLVGFLVSIVGGIVVGIVVFRRRTDGLSRAAGLVMALALPLGIGLGLLGSAIDPHDDAWFFAAICVPTGIAWVLLGVSLRSVRRPAAARFATAS
jgi:hypothetical protein